MEHLVLNKEKSQGLFDKGIVIDTQFYYDVENNLIFSFKDNNKRLSYIRVKDGALIETARSKELIPAPMLEELIDYRKPFCVYLYLSEIHINEDPKTALADLLLKVNN